jgi:hypothetical protein
MYGYGDVLAYRVERVDYEMLDLSNAGEFSIANNIYFLRWTIFLIPLTMIFFYFYDSPAIEPFAGWVLFGVLFIMIVFAVAMGREWAEVRFTEVPTFGTDAEGVRAFVRIIRTRKHDAVLDELRQRWRERMRQLYGSLNIAGGLEPEQLRLAELLRLGIISDDEHRAMVEALHLAFAGGPGMAAKIGH